MNTDDRYYDRIRHGLGTLGDLAGPTLSFDDLTLEAVAPHQVETNLSRPRWAVAASVLVAALVGTVVLAMVSGSDTPTIEVTNSPDTACSGASSDVDEVPACAIAASVFNSRDTNTVVFMEPAATAAQISAIAERLATSREVLGFTFLDQQQTYEEFVEVFSDNPQLTEVVSPADLPPSFRFELAPTAAQLLDEISGYDGIETILSTIDGSYSPDPESAD